MAKKKCPACSQLFAETAVFCPNDGKKLVDEEESGDKFIGLVLDAKYQVDRLIGKGGMGNVYEAKHLHMGLPVAIKILHPHLVTDSTAVERFRREARSARTVNHPNAISIMDFGVTSDNILYLAMELINGVSLQEVLKKETTIDTTRAVKMMHQVCLAVDAAHQKAIIHRDLKPDNILILDYGTESEKVKVIDFSIAKMKESGKDPNLTSAGVVVGTPQYISPEQAQGLELDSRSDIYSLGIILYQMLTGNVPFTGKTSAMLLMQHIQAKPKPPREIKPEIPVKLEAVILRALSKQAKDRQQTAADLARDLEEALIATPAPAPVAQKEEVKPDKGSGGPKMEDKPLPQPPPEPKKSFWQRLISLVFAR